MSFPPASPERKRGERKRESIRDKLQQESIEKSLIVYRYYYIYILASKKNGTLYIGVTNNLVKRIYEHKRNLVKGFTKKYNIHRLVYYEQTTDINSAILREKRIKKWKRQWKIELIEKFNPYWEDLYYKLMG